MFGCILNLSHFGLWFIDFSLDWSINFNRRISKMSSAGFEDQPHKISTNLSFFHKRLVHVLWAWNELPDKILTQKLSVQTRWWPHHHGHWKLQRTQHQRKTQHSQHVSYNVIRIYTIDAFMVVGHSNFQQADHCSQLLFVTCNMCWFLSRVSITSLQASCEKQFAWSSSLPSHILVNACHKSSRNYLVVDRETS